MGRRCQPLLHKISQILQGITQDRWQLCQIQAIHQVLHLEAEFGIALNTQATLEEQTIRIFFASGYQDQIIQVRRERGISLWCLCRHL